LSFDVDIFGLATVSATYFLIGLYICSTFWSPCRLSLVLSPTRKGHRDSSKLQFTLNYDLYGKGPPPSPARHKFSLQNKLISFPECNQQPETPFPES